MTVQELEQKLRDLQTSIPSQTEVVFASDITTTINIMVITDGGVKKVVIGEA